jgi:Rrf2 family nitric oxide-sensitive transcriptional repressor
MRLTLHTDYAMRVLLHLACEPESQSSIGEIATLYGISRNHLMKVVQTLSRAGLVSATRGRSGGIRLGRAAALITVGDVVRLTEDGFELVDCSRCLITGLCDLPPVLNEATRAFLAVLDSHTIADMLTRREQLRHVLRIPLAEPAAFARSRRSQSRRDEPNTSAPPDEAAA